MWQKDITKHVNRTAEKTVVSANIVQLIQSGGVGIGFKDDNLIHLDYVWPKDENHIL